MNIDIAELEPTPDSYKATITSFAERHSLLNAMLLREFDPEHQAMVEQANAAYTLTEESDAEVFSLDGFLVKAESTGVLKNRTDAKAALKDAKQAKEDADKALKILRGDYIDEDLDALITQSIKPTDKSALSAGLSLAEQSPATPALGPAKRRTWSAVTWPYMQEVFKTGQYATAKEFFRALETKAGADSPFERGTAENRGNLFVRETRTSVAFKTIQNKVWPGLKKG